MSGKKNYKVLPNRAIPKHNGGLFLFTGNVEHFIEGTQKQINGTLFLSSWSVNLLNKVKQFKNNYNK